MYLLILSAIPIASLSYINLHPTMYLLILFRLANAFLHSTHLHPTMYLLIRLLTVTFLLKSLFTSHYVSINSSDTVYSSNQALIFTSHYVSINSYCLCNFNTTFEHLHPTMYLLILFLVPAPGIKYCHLHPTMYLLIPLRK